jgi:hypothetical protein
MQITSTGVISLPAVTTSMIDADTTGKAIVTKEYLSTANYWTKTVNDIQNNNTGIVKIGGTVTNGTGNQKLHVNGAIICSDRILTTGSSGFVFGDAATGMGLNGNEVRFTSYLGTTGNAWNFNPIYLATTSGNLNILNFSNTINPTSGTGVFNIFNMSPTINQTGGASGITRGLYINPTLTAAADFRAIEVVTGKVIVPTAANSNEAINKGQLESYTTTQLAGKMNNPSLTANFIPKALTATTIGNSRLWDTGTKLGIGATNTPTEDLTFGNQDNRTIAIELSDSTTIGRDLIVTAGKTVNYSLNTYFNSINQPAGSWFGLAVSTTGVVYTQNSVNRNVYTQTGGSGNFIDTGITLASTACNFAAHINGNMYVTINNVGIYMQTGGAGSFSLVQTLSGVKGIACNPINGNVYACVLGGDIYMQTAGAGAFIALGQTTRRWEGLAVHINGNVYASVDAGDIYMQTGGIDTFNPLGQTIRQWGLMACNPINGDVYALGINVEWAGAADIYIQTGGAGAFAATGNTLNSWRGIAAYPNGNMYACSYSGSNANIFVQNNATVGTSDLQGGTLKLNSGTGKGTGSSDIEMWTGQVLTSGTTMQTATLRAKIDNTGLMTLPSVTNALIDADTTGKAVVTKEYVSSVSSSWALVNTYALMLQIPTPTNLLIVKVLNDENKQFANTIYQLYPDGVRMWIAANQDN